MPLQTAVLAIVSAAVWDQWIGDPRWCPHPVVLMGVLIQRLRIWLEAIASGRPLVLRLGGVLITVVLVGSSVAVGWALERPVLLDVMPQRGLGFIVVVVALASALAAKSLRQSVQAVLQALPPEAGSSSQGQDLSAARQKLSWIVGRDVSQLNRSDILRAAAESASENAVDGLFAPLFWMMVGAGLWRFSSQLPGPLALAWGFKASSTLDSMLGYRQGTLRWLGTAGAKLDDWLTWIPCRLVMMTLPLVSRPWRQLPSLIIAAEREGSMDPSPNAGRSEAIFAHCAGVQLGGRNRYGDRFVTKPTLASDQAPANRTGVTKILALTARLELLWLMLVIVVVSLIP